MTNRHDVRVSLHSELAADRPIMLNFIYTTCTTICPVLSATFSQAQSELEVETMRPRLVSITIDPEHDTPSKLRDYARKIDAGPDWRFLTGELGAIIAIQQAFDAYRGDKMSHMPLTFLRVTPKDPWVRLDGFTSAADLAREYRDLLSVSDGT